MSAPTDELSPLLELLAQVEREVHLRRQAVLDLVSPLEAALSTYRRAVEEELMTTYATSHQHKLPRVTTRGRRAAAEQLLTAVSALPELNARSEAKGLGEVTPPSPREAESPGGIRSGQEHGAAHPESGPSPGLRSGSALPEPVARTFEQVLPRVAAACRGRRLAIVGVLSGRRKPLPSPLEEATDWIDTEGGGRAALGLATRIRQGRLFSLVICDQSISHQQTEPLLAAARAMRIPIGFAGKGGAGAIARALEAIEEQLESASGS